MKYLIFNPETGGYIGHSERNNELYSHITDVEHAQKWATKAEIYALREHFSDYWYKHKLEIHELVLTSRHIHF